MNEVKHDFRQLVDDLRELHITLRSCDEPTWVAARRNIEALQGQIAVLSINGVFHSVRHVD